MTVISDTYTKTQDRRIQEDGTHQITKSGKRSKRH